MQVECLANLRSLGWCVDERAARPFLLPPEVTARHPRLPASLVEFLSRVASCVNATETTWFLCEGDFCGTTGSAYRWDEWERLSLEAADGDERMTSEIRSFWDDHLPILLSVGDGYSYHAVVTAAEGFGRVVAGRDPEFEATAVVAESFGQFLTWLAGMKGASS